MNSMNGRNELKGRENKRTLRHEPLESRICLSASSGWDGPGQGSATLTYTIGDAPAAVGQAAFETAVKTALKAWSDVADIDFVETQQAGLRDSLDFTFGRIDGSGRVLAQAYLPDDVNSPRIAGDVKFDASENWEIGNARGGRATDLVMVAVHEIGHALGLDHSQARGSVMNDSVSPSASFRQLPAADVDAALQLYAPADPRSTTDPGDLGSFPTNVAPTPAPIPTDGFVSPTDSGFKPGDGDRGDDGVGSDSPSEEPTSRPRHGGHWRGWHRWTWWTRGGRGTSDGGDASDAPNDQSDTSTRWTRRFNVRVWRIWV